MRRLTVEGQRWIEENFDRLAEALGGDRQVRAPSTRPRCSVAHLTALAKGMRKARMAHAIGDIGMRTGFEHGARVRGNLGRGAKDLAAFGPVTFESICEGYYSTMTLEPDGSFDDPSERKVNDDDRARLGIPRGSRTVVTVVVDARFRCPQHRTLLERLSKHYQRRDINSDPRACPARQGP